MVRRQMDTTGSTVVQMWECNLIFCANLVTDHYFVNVIKLIPIFIFVKLVFV
jgi:hypothetical protein